MKKILLLTALISFSFMNAQTIVFEEDFDGSGSGFGTWTAIDVDGKAPDTSASNAYSALIGTQGWALLDFTNDVLPSISATDFDQMNIAGNVIGAHSWYNPVGQSDDWAISPSIDLTAVTGTIELKWDAVSIAGNPAYNEDYVVKISTTGANIADFTTDLLDVTLETNVSPTTHTVDLSDYAGEIIYLAFNDDSDDRWGVVVDNIVITKQTAASINDNILSSSVSIYPNVTSDNFTIKNTSNLALTSVSIFDINGRVVSTSNLNNLIGEKSINVSNLSAGMYFVEINSADAKITRKLIKK